ncbi:hypothetical protein GCM10023175_69310 [Pseudonocardia xishanensis]|uniref:Uncharacterized protein n=1 Tax=Pseudonocardia xishanensis TaxID=630995 RepID=A0ABP8S4T7_9PSEU
MRLATAEIDSPTDDGIPADGRPAPLTESILRARVRRPAILNRPGPARQPSRENLLRDLHNALRSDYRPPGTTRSESGVDHPARRGPHTAPKAAPPKGGTTMCTGNGRPQPPPPPRPGSPRPSPR